MQFRTLGKEKRLVKSSYKNVNIRIELTLRPKMQGDFPSVLVLARKEMERVHLIIWNYVMENLSSFKQAKLLPNCLSLSLMAHVNSNVLQLYRALLLIGHFPIHYVTYCLERNTIPISEELFKASLLQFLSQRPKPSLETKTSCLRT